MDEQEHQRAVLREWAFLFAVGTGVCLAALLGMAVRTVWLEPRSMIGMASTCVVLPMIACTGGLLIIVAVGQTAFSVRERQITRVFGTLLAVLGGFCVCLG